MSPWALSIRRPVLATVFSLALVVFGLIGYRNLSVRELPDIEFPTVSVVTILPGASPEVVEKEVTEVLEEAISTIEGIDTLSSRSVEQTSNISIQFNLDRNIDLAAQDVRDRVARARSELPLDAEEPIVDKVDLDARAILWVSLNSDRASLRELSNFAENVVKERLQRLPGVGSVPIGGEKRLAIRIELDAARLGAHRLSVGDVVEALRRENVEIPSGRIEGMSREFVVNTEGEIGSAEEFEDLIVAYRGGSAVRLREVGRAVEGDEGERSLARFNLRPHVSVGIVKQSNANAVSVARAVRAEVLAMQDGLPPGYNMVVTYDGARFIEESVDEVQQALFIAGLLVILVIFLFLHTPRSALIPAVTIPTSLLTTFGVMYFLGFTINSLTLLALTLSIGVVVDDAIIVLENAHRHLEQGERRRVAALNGTNEIAFAAIATTLTLVAVFVPVAFIQGVIGRFFFEFGVTVAIAIVASSFVALTLTPMLCSRFLVLDEPTGIFARFEAAVAVLARRYGRILDAALDRRGPVVVGAVAILLATVGLFYALGREFVPPEDRGGFLVILESPEGSTLAAHNERQMRVEQILASLPEMRAATAFAGASSGRQGATNRGIIFTRLHHRSERERSQHELLSMLRGRFAEIPGVRVFATPFSGLPTGSRGKPLEFVIQNPDFDALQKYTPEFVERVRALPGLTGVDSDLRINKPELRVQIDRDKAASLGVSVSDVANTLRILLGGADVTKFRYGNERYDVIVRLEEEDRALPQQIESLYVRSRSGELVQLANLVEVREGVGPSTLNHYNRRRSVVIDANLDGKPLGTALAEVEEIAREVLPPGFTTAVGGESKEFEESFAGLAFTFALAVLAVYFVLAGQFESFVHPLTILLALPLALFGAFSLLGILGMTLNVYSFIGMVMLVGLVTKNSILLVDYAGRLREEGVDARSAVSRAGAVRLRPILMTALSTLFGILPIAVGWGAGAESRRPLGVVVAGGIIVSTLLTLVVVPVFYTLVDEALVRIRSRSGRGAEAAG
jgi:multidrug efflux pump